MTRFNPFCGSHIYWPWIVALPPYCLLLLIVSKRTPFTMWSLPMIYHEFFIKREIIYSSTSNRFGWWLLHSNSIASALRWCDFEIDYFFENIYENKNNLRDSCTNGIFIYFQSFKPFSLSNRCYFGEFIYHFFRSSRVHFCSFTLNRNVRALLTQTERVKNKRICRKKSK